MLTIYDMSEFSELFQQVTLLLGPYGFTGKAFLHVAYAV